MTTRTVIASLLLTVFSVVCTPLVAAAQSAMSTSSAQQGFREDPDNFLAPWIGFHFENGLSEVDLGGDERPRAFGATLGFWQQGVVGGELEFGYAKNFFGDPDLLGTNDLLTFTGSAVIGPWIHVGDNAAVRPYGQIGGGLARGKVEDFIVFGDDQRNRGVITFGGGVNFYATRNLGVRADVRVFRDVGSDDDDPDGFGITNRTYKRLTLGVLLAF